jgi:thiamine biosynthesis lipoprotein
MSINAKDFHNQIDSLFLELDSSLSTYASYSLISGLNKGDTSLLLDTFFLSVFKASQQVSKATDGLFDCTVAPLVNAWGFGPNALDSTLLDSMQIQSLLKNIGYQSILLKGDTLLSNPKKRSLDFNALAQGYSVDVIGHFLESQGIENYLVEVGGELKAKGYNSRNKKWLIGIDKPSKNIDKNDRFQLKLELFNKSLATSGNYRKFYKKNDRVYSHTIHPKTGYPVQHSLLSASVVADECMLADAYATAFMVMGLDSTIAFLKSRNDLEVFLIYSNENNEWENWSTKGFEEMIIR